MRTIALLTLMLGISAPLGCCKSNASEDSKPSSSADTPAAASNKPPSANTPSAADKKSAWVEKNGSVKTKFGFAVPGGGASTEKKGGFSMSTGSTVSYVYPTGDEADLVGGFLQLAKQDGVEVIDDPSPFGKAWKLIYAQKPYKAHVVKRSGKEECVLTIQTP